MRDDPFNRVVADRTVEPDLDDTGDFTRGERVVLDLELEDVFAHRLR
jgi:hypothetical protein